MSVRRLVLGLTLAILTASAMPAMAADAPWSEAQVKHDEMQMEIAWLSDPQTMLCPLIPVFEGTGFKLYGNVPNPEIGAKVLQLVREQTSFEVTDLIQVRPSMAVRPVREVVDRMQRDALRALGEAFPSHAKHLSLTIESSGRFTVSGPLPSLEEKRTASRRLKQVRGCSAVINEIAVQPAARQGQPVQFVSADGRLVLPLTDSAVKPAETAANPGEALLDFQNQPLPAGVSRAKFSPQLSEQPSANPQQPRVAGEKGFSALTLKRQIESACGMDARQVVVLGSPNGLFVRIKTRNEDEAKRLFDKVIQLPELKPYQVQLQIQSEQGSLRR